MDEAFKIFTEQLREGKTEKIDLKVSPDFLDITEEGLRFEGLVETTGEAYTADDNLILHLNATAHALIPCSICNAPVATTITVTNFYHTEPLETLKSGSFNFQEVLREAILLEVPPFAECHQGKCPQRHELKKYLKTSDLSKDNGHKPFADIDLDQFKR